MPEVIRWALIFGVFILTIGLVSAYGSRRRAIQLHAGNERNPPAPAALNTLTTKKHVRRSARGYHDVTSNVTTTANDADDLGVMSMAAGGGKLNGEESLASVGNSSR